MQACAEQQRLLSHNVALWGCNGHDIKCNNEHNSAATLSDAEREARFRRVRTATLKALEGGWISLSWWGNQSLAPIPPFSAKISFSCRGRSLIHCQYFSSFPGLNDRSAEERFSGSAHGSCSGRQAAALAPIKLLSALGRWLLILVS